MRCAPAEGPASADSIEIKFGGRVVPDTVISKPPSWPDDDPDFEKYNSLNAGTSTS
jgi:hypothetical protein